MMSSENMYKERREIAALLEGALLKPRFQKDPRDCPQILFFSGGSALRDVAKELAELTANSAHVISTFDSGGSTGEIRRFFSMPAPGDLRSRLVSLADCRKPEVEAAALFFENRLERNGNEEPSDILRQLAGGGHEWIRALAPEHASFFKACLKSFFEAMPHGFDLKGAALGNLLIVGDYLSTGRSLSKSVARFSRLLGCRGKVIPVSETARHLAVRLKDGTVLAGQHLFTGKGESGPLASRISEMFFCSSLEPAQPDSAFCGMEAKAAIEGSGLVCYPIGSFYSSILSSLQVEGVSEAVLKSPALKLYIPNPAFDRESSGLSLVEQLRLLCKTVTGMERAGGALDLMLVDSAHGIYPEGIPYEWCAEQGVRIIDYGFVEPAGTRVLASPARLALFLFLLAHYEV